MLRRSVVAMLLAAMLAPTTTTFAQDSGQQGRTPRVPRPPSSHQLETEPQPVATSQPRPAESGLAPPAPSGVARSRVRSHVASEERAIALTLDDGYGPDHRVLELIEAYGVHGTAFIVGDVADSDPMFVRELVRLGWMVCSHTQTHAQLTKLGHAEIRQEMVSGIESVASVVGYRCPYFRAPYGSVDSRVAAMADALGVQIIGWDASISDSAPAGTDPDLQTRIAIEAIGPGSILLGHFGGTNSYDVLKAVFEWLRTSGYSVGSVSELIEGNTRLLPEVADPNAQQAVEAVASALEPVARATQEASTGLSPAELATYATGLASLMSLVWRRRGGRRRVRRPSPAAATLEPL